MIIECKGCARRYQVDDTRLKPGGSRVRCSSCGHVFTADPAGNDIPDEAGTAFSCAERRRSARTPVSIPTLCTTTDEEGRPLELHLGTLKEVSPQGAAIELFRRKLSEVLGLTIVGADLKEFQIAGRIRNANAYRSGWMRIGLSLHGPEPDVGRFVAQAIRTHQQSDARRSRPADGRPAPDRAPASSLH